MNGTIGVCYQLAFFTAQDIERLLCDCGFIRDYCFLIASQLFLRAFLEGKTPAICHFVSALQQLMQHGVENNTKLKVFIFHCIFYSYFKF